MADCSERERGSKETPDDINERRWLPLHCRGDKAVFAELVRAYRAPVYNYLVRCGVDRESQDDLFQEIFMRIHRAAGSYQPVRPLKPWLFTIAANAVRNHFRRRRVDEIAFPEKAEANVPSADPGPERVARARETLRWLEDAVAALPLAQREVLVLTCFEEVNQETAATILQMPVNTVKTNLRRARLALMEARGRRNAGER